MKQYRKQILKIASMLIMIMILAVTGGCQKEENNDVQSVIENLIPPTSSPTPTISTSSADSKVYDARVEMKTYKLVGEEEVTTFQCGEKYRLELNWTNVNSDDLNKKIGKDEITLNVEISFGDNTCLSVEYFSNGGVSFTKNENTYVATVKCKKGNYPDFTKGYFVFGTDAVDGMPESEITEKITVSVKPTEYNGETKEKKLKKISFTINGNYMNDEKTIEVVKNIWIQPGKYDFTEASNWYQNVSWSAKKTTVEIKVPEHCPGIKISVYKDESRKEFYGEKEFACAEKEQEVTVVIANLLKEFLSEDIYEEKLNNGGETFYLTVTAIGANGYVDTSFNVDFKVK